MKANKMEKFVEGVGDYEVIILQKIRLKYEKCYII